MIAPCDIRSAGVRPAPEAARRLRVGVFGGALDTGNNGVSALGLGTVAGLVGAEPGAEVTLFGYTRGSRTARLDVCQPPPDVSLVGCFASRRYYRGDNLVSLRVAAALGWRPAMLRRLADLDAVLDISGGDSFADLYGAKRFKDVANPKLLAVQLGVPLVLLPQTYGPFRAAGSRRSAARILASASQVWARDAGSLRLAAELLGRAFDPDRHRQGVDVAFGLPARTPDDAELLERVRGFRARHELLVGLNVSGLLYNGPDAGRGFGLLGSYRDLMEELLAALLERGNVGVLLVPHVGGGGNDMESDPLAGDRLCSRLSREARARVLSLPLVGPMESKYLVGMCDWFCGTRMHACIAGISQGVPTTAVAYSDKTLGVFETAGVGSSVVDPRRLETGELVTRITDDLDARRETRCVLLDRLPGIQRTLRDQFALIAGVRR